MKIGILTFHKAYNYGAFLQCYSLQKQLAVDFPDFNVEVIDFASKNMVGSYHLSRIEMIFGIKGAQNKPSIILIAKRIASEIVHWKNKQFIINQNIKRRANFQNISNYLPLSKGSLVSDSPEEFKSFIESQKYDCLIVGSDAIWNDNQTSWPNLYLLHDISCDNKLSYAASTYGMDYSGFDQNHSSYVRDALAGFKFIGVRDAVTETYVKSRNGEVKDRVYHTCDPSIFLDLNNLPVDHKALKAKLIQKGIDFSRPIIGLMCDNWLAQKVRNELGEDYQYVSIYVYTETADVFLDELEPFEWAIVFSFFNATFTHYFHGTLFSIKNGTPTFAIEKRTKYNSRYKTKIQDVLTRLQLIETNYYKYEDMRPFEWNQIVNMIKNADKDFIEYEYQRRLAQETESYQFFKTKLGEILK